MDISVKQTYFEQSAFFKDIKYFCLKTIVFFNNEKREMENLNNLI